MSNIAVFSDRIVTRLKDEFQGRARVRHFPADIEAESKKPRQYAEIWVAFDGRSAAIANPASLTHPVVQSQTYGFNLIHLNKDVRGADSDYTVIYQQIDDCLQLLSGFNIGNPEGPKALLSEVYARFRSLTKDFWIYEQRFELMATHASPRSNSRSS